MRIIELSQISENLHTIPLKNGKVATIKQVIQTKVPSVNPNEEIYVYKYNVPCPVCDTLNSGFSYDGKYFGDTHINCKFCGIYFRPVVKS